jgi:PAS domain S-box-containing protein
VTSWNPGAQRFKGYEAAEILGRHFSCFYTEEDRRSGLPARALETAAREGRFENEGWRVRKDGGRFWANVIIDPIHEPSGQLVGFAKVTRDLTERRQAREQLETAREQLVQSQKMEAVGQLTGGIAHDFNNLLMAILGSLELLRKRLPDQDEYMRLIDNAIAGAQRGATLTQRMLAFSRRQTLDPEAVDVRALVHGMSEFLQRSLGPSNPIETQFPETLAPVRADANQLELALLNLAVNARDAMPHGGAIIIAAREETVPADSVHRLESGPHVCLSVTDTGEGMDEATLARATEPFFTTKGIGKGTGLGLSAVHGVMEQSGGELVLKSTKGKGTTAELWLPVAIGEPAHERIRPSAEPDTAEAGRPLVVLAVEDDSLVLMNTLAMLEDLGHSVIEASSGDEALEILRQESHVDLVITDQAMPRMTGTQLIEAIKEEWPSLAVILATGYAELPADADPATPRLDKPFTPRALANAIARCMPADRAAAGQAAGAS